MKIVITYGVVLLSAGYSMAQVVSGRQVIGSIGTTHRTGSTCMMAITAGEVAIGTDSRGERSISSGFHQPTPKAGLTFEMTVEPATCPTSTDGYAELIEISGCSGPYEVVWSNGITGLVNERLGVGSHSVTVAGIGCSTTYSFEIGTGPLSACMLNFFTAFSPNGDEVNDLWTIENIERPEFRINEVEIFNRYGVQIWRGVNYDNRSVAWDGRNAKGDPLPAGTYFFVVEVAGVTHKGYIEITL